MRRIHPLISLVLLFAVLVLLGRPASAQEFLARQIENLVSTDSLKVKIDGLSGALTGNLRIAGVTVSDPQGPFLTARDLAMDWSPLAIVRSNVAVQSLTAGQITLERLPQLPPSPADQSSGGGLPSFTADIQRIAVTEFVLGEAIAGTRARLSMDARLVLAADPSRLETSVDINRLDRPGRIAATVLYAPGDNRLEVNVDAGEPAGGLVASLLKIPGAPPVQLTVNGSGPLSDFTANGALGVSGENAATLTARVNDVAAGRQVAASLNVAAERFAPDAYRAYVRGGANLDAAVLIRPDGVLGIERAELSSQALKLDMSGTFDRAGPQTALDIALAAPDGGPIPLRFGEGTGQTVVDISRLRGTFAGALNAATIDLAADLPQAGYGPYAARDLALTLASRGFDVSNLSGPLALTADAASVAAPDGISARFTRGRVRITADGALASDSLTLNAGRISTAAANAAISGTAALDFATFDLTLSSDFETLALSAAAVPLAGDRLALAGRVRRGTDGTLAADSLSVRGGGLTIDGSARLAGGDVDAKLRGTLDVPSRENSAISGKADFSLTASGPTTQPDVDIALNSQGLRVNGRELADVKVEARGAFTGSSPTGTVDLSGTLDGTPLTGTARLATLPSGERRISDLAIRQGPNSVSGDLRLTTSGAPVGRLDVAVSDIGPLAALALQQLSGDLNGRIDLSVNGEDFPVAAVDLASRKLAAAGSTLNGVALDLSVEDYLGTPRPSGTVRADGIESGAARIEALAIDLAKAGEGTRLDAKAKANGIPVALGGIATITPVETSIALETLTAAIPNAAVSLEQPSRVTIANGVTTLSPTVVKAGDGSLRLSGTAGETLDLDATLDRLPAALANAFVSGLDASGTISGTARATGPAGRPDAAFEITGTGITAREIAEAGVPPIELRASGTYADAVLTLSQARASMGDAVLEASGTAGETLDLDARLQNVPVALANGFVPGLKAAGTISGTARATGPAARAGAVFDIAGTGISAEETRKAGIAPATLRLAGSYAEATADLETAVVNIGEAVIRASGRIGETLDLDIQLGKVPVGLANAFVPGLGATGTVSGEATAGGTLQNPNAVFKLTGTGITAERIAASGVAPLSLDIAGRLAGKTATIERGSVRVGDGSLTATGTVGETLDLRVAMDKLPVGLANGFVPGLGAAGTLSGTATAEGSIGDPKAGFDIRADGVSTTQTRAAKAPAIDAVASGRYENGAVAVRTGRVSVGGGTIDVSGRAGRELDLTIAIRDLPASLAGAAASGIDPAGTINGTARATGAASNPRASFDLDVGGFTIAQTRDAGVGPLAIRANGDYADKTLRIDTRLSGGAGLAFSANGTIGLAGTPEFNLRANGTAPLSLANRILAEGGRAAQGTVRIDVSVAGTAAAPKVDGTISTAGATFTDTGANVALRNINATIALSGQTATISAFSANLAAGGTITAGGTVGLTGGFPANIQIRGARARYADGELVAATLNAALTITGPLLDTPLLAGRIDLERMDVLVPSTFPSSLARIDVTHRNAPARVVKQQRELFPPAKAGGGGGGINLDIAFNAPGRIFVRGRGLDIEMGGSLRIQGSAAAPSITGGFELQRGRLIVLNKRLDFQSGRLAFTGELIPLLDLVATSDSGDVTVQVAVTGPANDPSFSFSSSPALPQDEVLARLIFNQGTTNLSPLQIAQLAEAAAQLAGVGGSTGLLENLRSQLGVDDIDIRTTADGQTAVGVGKYINDRTYFGVDSTGRASINLDVGKGVKARGAVTSEGGGEVGIFYENEF